MTVVVFSAFRERWENLEREDVKENLVLRFLYGYTSYSATMMFSPNISLIVLHYLLMTLMSSSTQ